MYASHFLQQNYRVTAFN